MVFFGFLIINFCFCEINLTIFNELGILIPPGILPVKLDSLNENLYMNQKIILNDPFYKLLKIFIYFTIITFILFMVVILYKLLKKKKNHIIENKEYLNNSNNLNK